MRFHSAGVGRSPRRASAAGPGPLNRSADLADAGLSVVVEQQVSVTGSGVTPTAAVTGGIALDDLRRVFPGY